MPDRRASAAMAQDNLAGIERPQLENLRFAGASPHRSANTDSPERCRSTPAPLRLAGVRSAAMKQEYDSALLESTPLRKLNWPRRSGRLISTWQSIAHLWMHWRRERAIKRTVATLAQFDDRILWDIGIPDRSRIEEVVRLEQRGALVKPDNSGWRVRRMSQN